MKATARSYAAGVLDADGTVRICRSRQPKNTKAYRHGLRVSVSNSDLTLLRWFKAELGGNLMLLLPRAEGHRPVHRWYLHGVLAGKMLRSVLPYLIVKRERALIGLEFVHTIQKPGIHLPLKLFTQREALYWTMRTLNRRGTR